MREYSIPWKTFETTGIFHITAQNETEAKIRFKNILGHEAEITGEITSSEFDPIAKN